MITIQDRYKIRIYEKYRDLIKSGKMIDNHDLSKIFEWFSCIFLSSFNPPVSPNPGVSINVIIN
jgi:hypothetical protein